MHVLHAGGGIDALMHDVGGGETLRRTADFAMDIGIDVAVGGDALVVQQRRVRTHRCLRVEDGGQDFVLDLDQPAGRFRCGLGFRDDRGDALAHKADHVVEHIGVVGIDEVVLMRGGAVEAARHVFPGEDGDDPGTAAARCVRSARIRAWACGDRSTLRCSSPSIATSIV